MPPVTANAGDKFLVIVKGSQEEQTTITEFYFQAATPIDDVELRLIVALWECYRDTFLVGASSSWTIQKFIWKQVNPVLGIEREFLPPGGAVGSVAGDFLPTFNAAVISKRTPLGGRSHRGRMYLPGIPESSTAGSVLTLPGDYWLNLIAFAACLAGKFILADPPPANSFQMMLYSRKLGGSTFPLGNAGFTSITSLVPSRMLGTMRSRKIRLVA